MFVYICLFLCPWSSQQQLSCSACVFLRVCLKEFESRRMRDTSLFSFRANGGWRDGWRGDATIGRDQCEQETSGALCRCAAGAGTACSFTAPHHLPRNPSTHHNNDELDLINSSAQLLEPWRGQESLMGICLHTSATMKTILCPIWSTWKIDQNRRTQGAPYWLSAGEFLSIRTFTYWMQGLVIRGAFVASHLSPGLVKRHYNHIALWKELVPCPEKHGSRCYKQLTVAAGWWTTFRWLQQSPCVWPHGILQHGNARGLSWTHGRWSTASGKVYGADLELTEEVEWGNREFLNILI